MSDNVLQTIQKLLQDVIAPDLRELRVRVEDLQKQMDLRNQAMEKLLDYRIEAVEKQVVGVQHQVAGVQQQMVYLEKSLLSAFAESQARIEITGSKAVIDIRERVAVLESKHA